MTVGPGGDCGKDILQSFPRNFFIWAVTQLEEIMIEQHYHESSARVLLPSAIQLEFMLWKRISNKNRESTDMAPGNVKQEEVRAMTNLHEPGGQAPSLKLPLG